MPSPWSFASLFETLATGGGRPAVVEVGDARLTTLSAAELHRLAGRLAAGLKAAGIEPGTPVALIADNSARWIASWLGLTLAEAVVVGLDDTATADELLHQITDCGCRFVFAGATHLDTLARLAAAEHTVIIALDDASAPPVRPWEDFLAPEPLALPALAPGDGAVTVYTSGTTGAPKSFTLTRANIAANVGALLDRGILAPEQPVVLALPLHHIYPLVVGCLTPLAAGAAIVLPAAISGRAILRALDAAAAQAMVGVPRLYGAMVAGIEGPIRAHGAAAGWGLDVACALVRAISRAGGPNLGPVLFRPLHKRLGGRLRLLVSGGARLDPETARRLESLGFEVLSGYGLAETASLFTGNLPGAKRSGTEGRVLVKGSAARIAGAGEDGVGEIELKGPNVFAGYLNNAEANAQAFTVDGWFRTGDLGRLDADGFLSVTGRSKEMIVLGGGKNVFPEDLEAHYGESPAIAEIAVLETEGRLVALVLPDLAALRAEAKTRAEDAVRVALDEAAHGLPPYQRLAGFAVTASPLPRTRLGKYRRFLLPALYQQARSGKVPRPAPALSAEDHEMLADPAGAKVWAWIEDRYGAQHPSLDSHLQLELGLDSLEWIKLSFELENRLGLTFDEGVFGRILTPRDLIREAIAAGAAPPPTATGAVSDILITPPGPVGRCLATALFVVNSGLMRLLFRLKAAGREHLPAPGTAFLIAANHASDLDPALIVAALPLRTARRLWWGGEVTRLFSGAIGRALGRIAHVFPIDERRPREALDLAGRILERGDALGWFPESWRSPSGALQRFLPGIGRLLIDHPVPVVPAYIAGSFEAMPRTARLPRPHPVTIHFGAPVTMEALAAEGEGESPEERIADGLRCRVAALEARAARA